MSFQSPWIYGALVGIPLLGGVLTVDRHREFARRPVRLRLHPPGHDPQYQRALGDCGAVGILPADRNFDRLAAYVVGEERLWPIIRAALPTLAVLTALALVMLAFAPVLAPYLR